MVQEDQLLRTNKSLTNLYQIQHEQKQHTKNNDDVDKYDRVADSLSLQNYDYEKTKKKWKNVSGDSVFEGNCRR
jgi:hypothetical protein